MSRLMARFMGALFAAVLWVAGAGNASAFTPPPNFVGTTFEGCRNNGDISLPIGGKFICADAAYTPGNLGKGWNELDLVPFHLITTSGNSAGPVTTYNLYIAADYRQGTLGYDFISVPTVNPVSDASCTVSAGPPIVVTGITGGTEDTLYRELTITQLQGKTCRFDWYQRLALEAAKFSGSNLQAYIFDQAGLSGGKSTIPLPVGEVKPQVIAKDMTASQGSDHAWNVTKSATTDKVGFGDVCRANAPTSLPVSITVTWTKFAAVPGGPITVITNVYATNPAARAITTNVTDRIYSGTTLLDTSLTTSVSVPAGMTKLVLTHSYTAAPGTTDLNDIATATYTDDVTGIAVPGQTTATAKADVQNTGPELNASASIADLEWMTGNGLKFAVATPTLGAFAPYPSASDPAYVAGTQTIGPVAWGVMGQGDSGSVTFDKTVYLDGKRITTGELSDAASLVGINGFTAMSGPFAINVSSTALVKFTLSKSIPTILGTGEKIEVKFRITRVNDPSYQRDETITFTGGAAAPLPIELTGLVPDTYTVEETSSLFFAVGSTTGVDSKLTPVGGKLKTVVLGADANGVVSNCSGTAAFENIVPLDRFPTAQVQKMTFPPLAAGDPDLSWSFTLTGPAGFCGAGCNSLTQSANAGAGYVAFVGSLLKEGTYFVTESPTKAPAWVQTSADPEGTVADKVCSFTVNFPQDIGATLSCSFTNTKQGKVKVVKTIKGLPLTTEQFTFQLRQGATGAAEGSALETLTTNVAPNGSTLSFATWLVPASTYQMCESMSAGWMTAFTDPNDPLFVPGAFQPPAGVIPNPNVDNSWLCVNFSVAAGQTKTIAVDNSPPPGGRALTIGYWKTHASCTTSSANKVAALDDALYASGGILKSSQIVSLVPLAGKGLYGQTKSTAPGTTPAVKGSTVDCPHAVSLLDKRDFGGTKKASDPLFNMAAQLVAVRLNFASGAYSCPKFATVVNTAEALLAQYKFTGFGYTGSVSKADATAANSLATKLDDYNNNRLGVCP